MDLDIRAKIMEEFNHWINVCGQEPTAKQMLFFLDMEGYLVYEDKK